MSYDSKKVYEELKKAHDFKGMSTSDVEKLRKGISTSTGLVEIDLQAPAKEIVPFYTPLLNQIPREKGNGGTSTQWRSILGVNAFPSTSIGVVEGHRNVDSQLLYGSYNAPYKSFGVEQFVTFEEQSASQPWTDTLNLSVEANLINFKTMEEQEIFGGNTDLQLGTAPNPTLTGFTGTSSLPSGTYRVNVVALSNDGYILYNNSSLVNVSGQITVTTLDGDVETRNQGLSAAATTQTLNVVSGSTIVASVPAVSGASGYLWFFGQSSDSATYAFSTTYLNTAAFSTIPVTGNQVLGTNFTVDYSTNPLVYDGLLTMAAQPITTAQGLNTTNLTNASNLGPIYTQQATIAAAVVQAGAPLGFTTNGFNGCTEIDNDLLSFWSNGNRKITPTDMWVSPRTKHALLKTMIPNGSVPMVRLNAPAMGPDAGQTVASTNTEAYVNPYAMGGNAKYININVHPNAPDGAILYTTSKIPYQYSNVSNPMKIKTRKDYYEIAWPVTTRKYSYGLYNESVLTHEALFSIGARVNINVG